MPKTKWTRIAELASAANRYGEAKASDGRWWAYRYDSDTDPEHSHVVIGHYSTEMIAIHFDGQLSAQRVAPINPGWGSQTDKVGINSILRYEKLKESYWSLFETDNKEE